MTRLIMVQRAFENASAMMRDTEATLDDAVKTLGGNPSERAMSRAWSRSTARRPPPRQRADAARRARSASGGASPTSARCCGVGGRVTEVSATHYRVRGLSATARLGDVVEHRSPCRHAQRRDRADRPRRGRWSRRSSTAPTPASATPSSTAAPSTSRPTSPGAAASSMRSAGRSTRGAALSGRDADAAPARPPRCRASASARLSRPACASSTSSRRSASASASASSPAPASASRRCSPCSPRADAFDTVVVALVGERGREVREFLEDTIGHKNMAKTVAVVATSDESAMMRKRAPGTAMRDRRAFPRPRRPRAAGARFDHPLRPCAARGGDRHRRAAGGARLSRLGLHRPAEAARARRAGREPASGSITAIISVLVDGDDHNDPVADSVRGILDGHVVLDRAIAEQGRYPPVNPLASISRLAAKAWSDDERALVTRLQAMIARFEDTRDIRLLGAYQPGVDAELDMAVRQVPLIYEALAQSPEGPAVLRPVRRPGAPSEEQGEAAWRASGAVRARSRTRSTAGHRDRRRKACCRRAASRPAPSPAAKEGRPVERPGHRRARHHARPDLRVVSLVHLLQPGKVRRPRR